MRGRAGGSISREEGSTRPGKACVFGEVNERRQARANMGQGNGSRSYALIRNARPVKH